MDKEAEKQAVEAIVGAHEHTHEPTQVASAQPVELLFEAVAARAGLAESYTDVGAMLAHRWLEKEGKQATREALSEFVSELKRDKPGLFNAPAPVTPANTAPVSRAPSAPAPGVIESPTATWKSLRACGRYGEAKLFYARNQYAINRGQ